jgi:ectoine hydroxylase-related dioxygenase (phytanoyl-CoA dioxygenase family)
VPCPAGGAIFHNGLVAHGAGTNLTPRPRRAMTCAFMPDGATYNGRAHDMLAPDYVASLEVGDPIDDDRIFPLVWSRSSA